METEAPDSVCPVCLASFGAPDIPLVALVCGHVVHEECLEGMSAQGQGTAKCPICCAPVRAALKIFPSMSPRSPKTPGELPSGVVSNVAHLTAVVELLRASAAQGNRVMMELENVRGNISRCTQAATRAKEESLRAQNEKDDILKKMLSLLEKMEQSATKCGGLKAIYGAAAANKVRRWVEDGAIEGELEDLNEFKLLEKGRKVSSSLSSSSLSSSRARRTEPSTPEPQKETRTSSPTVSKQDKEKRRHFGLSFEELIDSDVKQDKNHSIDPLLAALKGRRPPSPKTLTEKPETMGAGRDRGLPLPKRTKDKTNWEQSRKKSPTPAQKERKDKPASSPRDIPEQEIIDID